jgi:hypothetical protein
MTRKFLAAGNSPKMLDAFWVHALRLTNRNAATPSLWIARAEFPAHILMVSPVRRPGNLLDFCRK